MYVWGYAIFENALSAQHSSIDPKKNYILFLLPTIYIIQFILLQNPMSIRREKGFNDRLKN